MMRVFWSKVFLGETGHQQGHFRQVKVYPCPQPCKNGMLPKSKEE